MFEIRENNSEATMSQIDDAAVRATSTQEKNTATVFDSLEYFETGPQGCK